MNSFKQLVQYVKSANWTGANQVFSEIMQRKVSNRLTTERKTVFEDTRNPRQVECLKCHKKWRTSEDEPKCPKCGADYSHISD
jgi:Zn finger protein HypA/HybF involved in hydrogenase expression